MLQNISNFENIYNICNIYIGIVQIKFVIFAKVSVCRLESSLLLQNLYVYKPGYCRSFFSLLRQRYITLCSIHELFEI